ncbi:MAG: Fpg/Nei family DNA glycosylase [Candidatus Paceibacterota bacterium]
MPELPEVQTTVTELNDQLVGLSIHGVWSSYDSKYYQGKRNIKDRDHFKRFKKETLNRTIVTINRIGKYILIRLSGDLTILIHMKMTGHLLYGRYRKAYRKEKEEKFADWIALEEGPLKEDPFNRFIRLVFTLSNGKHLVLSDARKFATVCFFDTDDPPKAVKRLGPDPLLKDFTFKVFLEILPYHSQKPIKSVLLDQEVIAGIGNIYSDEILWNSGIHPMSTTGAIPQKALFELYRSMKVILRQGVRLGGDSVSDYRNPSGAKGNYHYHHKAYQNTGSSCSRRGCKGVIRRCVIGGRSTHFCDQHQILYK